MQWLCRQLHREEGSIVVVGAIAVTVFAMLGAAALEVGKWFQDRRDLQLRTDAAALAAGDALNACFNIGSAQYPTEADADASIESWAKNYGGLNSAATGDTGSPYNKQIDGGSTFMSFQSDTNPSSGTPQPTRNLGPECFQDGNPNNTATSNVNLMTDVKTTQSGLPAWFSFSPLATTHGWARVQLQTVKALKPSLPLAIPDVNPLHVSVTFVDNGTGTALTCGTGPCVFPLSGPTNAGQLNNWTTSAPITIPMPAAGTQVGMRVGIGSQNGNCGGVNSTATYTCYDYGANGNAKPDGLVVLRSYPTAAQAGVTPALRAVNPTTCLPTDMPGGSPYFSTYQSSNGNCHNIAISANVDFPAGATNKALQYALSNGNNCNPNLAMTFQAGNTWTSSAFQTLATGQGPYNVCIDWSYKDASNTNQSGHFGVVQQIFSGSDGSDATAPGGPIMSASVTDSSTGAQVYSEPANANASINVTVALSGGVHINPRCFNPGNSGPNYSCATDPTIVLRSASTSGSLNYTINCGVVPGNPGQQNAVYQMIRFGCANTFSINSADICPDPANPSPTSCAPVQSVTGDKVGPVQSAMNDRLAPNGNCLANNYPNTDVKGDQRIFRLVDTDFTAYTGSGGNTLVPVVAFATFYVTGWDGAVSSCTTGMTKQNEPPPPSAVSNGNSANIWGHFIQFSTGDGIPSGITCKPGQIIPCVVALIR